MKALAVCSTYGRLPYLGRMLSAFSNQTYDDKHLVIVNDDKNIELCCDRKDVTIINLKVHIPIPYKRNIGVMIGNHDIIFPMDDDDIFLPNKMANHMKKYEGNIDNIGGYWSRDGYMIYGDDFQVHHPSPPNAISFSKKEWFKAGGYTNNARFEDHDLYVRLTNVLENNTNERDFVYGFGGVNYHVSLQGKEVASYEENAYKQLEDMNLVGKKFWIHPDFEQYNNICLLDKLYKERQETLPIKHLGDAKIDISHLL